MNNFFLFDFTKTDFETDPIHYHSKDLAPAHGVPLSCQLGEPDHGKPLFPSYQAIGRRQAGNQHQESCV
jgi:hypothetical protein